MGTALNNLLIVEGSQTDINDFKATAYKNDCEALSFNKLIPTPDYYKTQKEKQAFTFLTTGNKWGAGFGVLARQTKNTLTYFFNTKYTIASIKYLAIKYNNLKFTHLGFTIEDVLAWNYFQYESGDLKTSYKLSSEDFDFEIASDLYAYEYMAELYFKFEYLIDKKRNIFNNDFRNMNPFYESFKPSFYNLFHNSTFIKQHKKEYDEILKDVEFLNKQDLTWAKDIAYPFKTNELYHQLSFINNNFEGNTKKKYLDELNNNTDLSIYCRNELENAVLYAYRKVENLEFTKKITNEIIRQIEEDLNCFIKDSKKNRFFLNDYPGISPYFNPNIEVLNIFHSIYEWELLDDNVESILERVYEEIGKESIFDKEFEKKIDEAYKLFFEEEKKGQMLAKKVIEEAILFKKKCTESYNRLYEMRINGDLPFYFDFCQDTDLTDEKLYNITMRFELLGSFPSLNKKDNNHEVDDLPF